MQNNKQTKKNTDLKDRNTEEQTENVGNSQSIEETGGPPGPEPTRYGDWERKGRCIDF